jgi:tRNA pseudouridine55 synthase
VSTSVASHRHSEALDGILAIDKGIGPTSHDVVASLRRILGMRRIGHCGTLDPLASGVLVTCLGRYTRLSQWISAAEKEYESTFCLGAVSDTGDSQGTVVSRDVAVPPTLNQIDSAMMAFRGRIQQVPPAYSAVKIGGVRSYELARRQEKVTAPAREVHVSTFEVMSFRYPDLKVRVVCSKGTYVRALAHDLGEKLGCGGHVEQLRRVRAGTVDERDAITLDEVQRRIDDGRGIEHSFTSPKDALSPLPAVTLPAAPLSAFMHGNTVSIQGESTNKIPEFAAGSQCAVFDEGERLCGVGEWREENRGLRPLKVLGNER